METKIAAELIDELRRRRMTVGTAESCTAGMISAEIADVPGASDVLVGGIVSYANEVKEDLLDVPASVIETVGAVSEECARYMAAGALKKLCCDITVSVTGIAAPAAEHPKSLWERCASEWLTKREFTPRRCTSAARGNTQGRR